MTSLSAAARWRANDAIVRCSKESAAGGAVPEGALGRFVRRASRRDVEKALLAEQAHPRGGAEERPAGQAQLCVGEGPPAPQETEGQAGELLEGGELVQHESPTALQERLRVP